MINANGRMPDLSTEARKRIRAIVGANPDLRLVDEYLVVTPSFAKASVAFLDSPQTGWTQEVRCPCDTRS
jgi:hypothetical protein